jgi:hypothetical protein
VSSTVRMVFDALKCAQWQLFVLTSAAHEIDRRRGSDDARHRKDRDMTKGPGENDGH